MRSIASVSEEAQERSNEEYPSSQNLWGAPPERVLSHITHDLRAPLCAIMGYLDLVGRQVGKAAHPKAVEYLSLARENGQRMNQMVNDMMDMFYFEIGHTPLQCKKISTVSLLDRVYKTFSGLADLKKVRFTCRADEKTAAKVWADVRYLERALDNLVANALKFTPPGGSVRVRVKHSGRRTCFEIIDTGRGIPMEDQERIFEEFHQVSASDQHHGFGIGLAVTRAIVQAHQGSIRVESRLGKGSRFIFWIPDEPVTNDIVLGSYAMPSDGYGIACLAERRVDSSRHPGAGRRSDRRCAQRTLLAADGYL